MKRTKAILAALVMGLSCVLYGAEETQGGFTWFYEDASTGPGVCLTDVMPADPDRIPVTMTVPSTLGGMPVTEIAGYAIGNYLTDGGSWLTVTKVILPPTFERVGEPTWGYGISPEGVSPFNFDFFVEYIYDESVWTYEERMRRTPPTIEFQGPPPLNFRQGDLGDDEVMALFTYPKSGAYYDAWIAELDATVVAQETKAVAGACKWKGLHTTQYVPKFGERIRKTLAELDRIGQRGPAEKAICDALSAIIQVNEDPKARSAFAAFGIMVSGDVWAATRDFHEMVNYQPNTAIDVLASEGVYGLLAEAADALKAVPTDWTGSVRFAAEELPMLAAVRNGPEEMVIDGADAAMLKASLEGLCAFVQLARSYNLNFDLSKDVYDLRVPTITEDTTVAWDAIEARSSRTAVLDETGLEGRVCLQYAKLGKDLLIRVTSEAAMDPQSLSFHDYDTGKYAQIDCWSGTPSMCIGAWFSGGSETVDGTMRPVTDEGGRYGAVFRFPGKASALDGLTGSWGCGWYGASGGWFHCHGEEWLPIHEIPLETPGFGATRRTTTGLADGKVMAKRALASAADAMTLFKSRTDDSLHLFNLSEGMTLDELDAEAAHYDALAEAVDTPTKVGNEVVYLAPLFTAQGPTRNDLPERRYGEFVFGTEPDPTFRGILPGRMPEGMPTAPYCVVDLSAGADAETYPVTMLDAVPAGGWTDEYKTTKLVLKRVEAGRDPLGRYTVTKPFYVGVFEVTQKQWELVMGYNPAEDGYDDVWPGDTPVAHVGPARPVVDVSYTDIRGDSYETGADWPESDAVDADSFIGRLRERTGLKVDLPTIGQSEYACRAGTRSNYNNGGNSESDLRQLGRYGGNQTDGKGGYTSGSTTVGSYLPNKWGLYDMHGNVWEWCLDWGGDDSVGTSPVEPYVWEGDHCLHGGDWAGNANDCASSDWTIIGASSTYGPVYDNGMPVPGRYWYFGLRLACAAGENPNGDKPVQPYLWVAVTEGRGTVTGTGAYAPGTKVTLMSTPASGYVFAGWYTDSDCTRELMGAVDYRTARFPYVTGAQDTTVYAKFVSSEEDAAEGAISVEFPFEAIPEYGYVPGFPIEPLKVTVHSASLPTVTVTGLPTGLKFDSKTFTISGTPTKPGDYPVTVTAKNNSGASATVTADIRVQPPFEVTAVTTFGGIAGGVIGNPCRVVAYEAEAGILGQITAKAEGLPSGVTVGTEVTESETDDETEVVQIFFEGTPSATAEAKTYPVTVCVMYGESKVTKQYDFVVRKLPESLRGITLTAESDTVLVGGGEDETRLSGEAAWAKVELGFGSGAGEEPQYTLRTVTTFDYKAGDDAWAYDSADYVDGAERYVNSVYNPSTRMSGFHFVTDLTLEFPYTEAYTDVFLWENGKVDVYTGYYQESGICPFIWESETLPGAVLPCVIPDSYPLPDKDSPATVRVSGVPVDGLVAGTAYTLPMAVYDAAFPTVTATGLPTGMRWDTNAMSIVGTPTVPGLYSAVFTVKSGAVAKKATVELKVKNFVSSYIGMADTYDGMIPGVAIEPIGLILDSAVPANATVSVSGLPVGLKWVTASKTIEGTPTTPGAKTVTFTLTWTDAELGRMSEKATSTFIVEPFPALTLDVEDAMAAVGCKVTGGGAYPAGKSVSLRATPSRGYVFAGWYADEARTQPMTDGPSDYRATTFTYVTERVSTTLYARFVELDPEGVDKLTLTIPDVTDPGLVPGFPIDPLEIGVGSASLPTVTVSGLPSGLKWDAKTMTVTGTPAEPRTADGLTQARVVAKNASGTLTEVWTIRVQPPFTVEEAEPFGGKGGAVVGLPCGVHAFDVTAGVFDWLDSSDDSAVTATGLPEGITVDFVRPDADDVEAGNGAGRVVFVGTTYDPPKTYPVTVSVRYGDPNEPETWRTITKPYDFVVRELPNLRGVSLRAFSDTVPVGGGDEEEQLRGETAEAEVTIAFDADNGYTIGMKSSFASKSGNGSWSYDSDEAGTGDSEEYVATVNAVYDIKKKVAGFHFTDSRLYTSPLYREACADILLWEDGTVEFYTGHYYGAGAHPFIWEPDDLPGAKLPCTVPGGYPLPNQSRTEATVELEGLVDGSLPINELCAMKLTVYDVSFPTVSVAGLPTGLKWDAKTMTVSGTPTKSGFYDVVFTVQPGAKQPKMTATVPIRVTDVSEARFIVVETVKPLDEFGVEAEGFRPGKELLGTEGDEAGSIRIGAEPVISGLKVSGLPTGLKWNAATGFVYGTPTKPGRYTLTVSGTYTNPATGAKMTVNKTELIVILSYPTLSLFGTNPMGTVKGEGSYLPGSTITLSATAAKGCVFAGWYRMVTWPDDPMIGESQEIDGVELVPLEGLADYRTPSLKLVAPEWDTQVYARFVPEREDVLPGVGLEQHDSVIMLGGSLATDGDGRILLSPVPAAEYDIPLLIASHSLPKVTVTGLPAGLRLDQNLLRIGGFPTTPGLYEMTLKVTNQSGYQYSRIFSIRVGNINTLLGPESGWTDQPIGMDVGVTLTTEGLYNGALIGATASGLPPGVKWDSRTGTLSGVPTYAGEYTVTFRKDGETLTVTVVVTTTNPTCELIDPEGYGTTEELRLSVLSGDKTYQPAFRITPDSNTAAWPTVTTVGLPSGLKLEYETYESAIEASDCPFSPNFWGTWTDETFRDAFISGSTKAAPGVYPVLITVRNASGGQAEEVFEIVVGEPTWPVAERYATAEPSPLAEDPIAAVLELARDDLTVIRGGAELDRPFVASRGFEDTYGFTDYQGWYSDSVKSDSYVAHIGAPGEAELEPCVGLCAEYDERLALRPAISVDELVYQPMPDAWSLPITAGTYRVSREVYNWVTDETYTEIGLMMLNQNGTVTATFTSGALGTGWLLLTAGDLGTSDTARVLLLLENPVTGAMTSTVVAPEGGNTSLNAAWIPVESGLTY